VTDPLLVGPDVAMTAANRLERMVLNRMVLNRSNIRDFLQLRR
jgi:hypothetical protein